MTVHPAPFIPAILFATDADGDDLAVSTDAYEAGDVVGGLLRWAVAQRAVDPAGLVDAALIVDRDDQGAAFTLHLFNSAPTVIADGDAFANGLGDVDGVKLIGVPLTLSTYTDYGGFKRAFAAYNANEEPRWRTTNYVYGYLVCNATPTFPNATALSVGLACWRY